MDLRFLESFLLVVQEGTIAAAARRQNVTAAAVSQRIAALEAELCVRLLVREGRTMVASRDGEAIIPIARDLLDRRRDMDRLLAKERMAGTLSIGAISTALGQVGPHLVETLRRDAPNVSLQLVPSTSEELFKAFADRKIDMAILVEPSFELAKSKSFKTIIEEEIGIFRRVGASKDTPFVVYDRRSWGGAICWKALQNRQPDPSVVCEMDAPEVIAQMVRDGLGQAVLPRWQGLNISSGETEFEPLGSSRFVGLLCWQRDLDEPLTRCVRDAVDGAYRGL